ncbi:hypothetical protein NMY22_g10792 [Coprinellus aureogranulatus]|nr:hypothetical protein NMY22_g10792 [Coprinellus aureogranulatus]
MLEPEDDIPFHPNHPNQPWSQKCVCGKRFMQPNSYGLHAGTCTKLKSKLGKTLKAARKRRTEAMDVDSVPGEGSQLCGRKRKSAWLDDDNLDIDAVAPLKLCLPSTEQASTEKQDQGATANTGNIGAAQHQEGMVHSLANPPSPELGRGCRVKKMSYKIQPHTNFLPSSALPASLFPSVNPPKGSTEREEPDVGDRMLDALPSAPEASATSSPPALATVTTSPNEFGVYKVFKSDPRDIPHDPDNSTLPSDLREVPTSPVDATGQPPASQKPKPMPSFHPFPNMSSFLLGEWYWSDESGKSWESFQDLLAIVGSEGFQPHDVREANWSDISQKLASESMGNSNESGSSEEWIDESVLWKTSSVTINVPLNKGMNNSGCHAFTVPGFHHRPLVPLIKEKLESSGGREYFHTLGHELRWRPGPGKEDVRVYGEMYNCPAFLQAYDELQGSAPEPNCKRPRHIVGLMFASDSTMLATFGTAKLWPLYMFYANDSKYRRGKASEKLFETVAYFEKLPDNFKDFFVALSGNDTVPTPLMTHCHRELFHEQWKLLLDEDFIEAYRHGIVVKCFDGIERRFYPRIFTYSVDYPEKILLASIKNLGTFPCPRCTVHMEDVPRMGQKHDRRNRVRLARTDDEARRKEISTVRNFIYKKMYSITSDVVKERLFPGSLVASENAFSHKLSSLGFDLYRMLVVDFMHEFELGVWKAVFIQLLRILDASSKASLSELDKRYRAMPTFGKDTIRRFVNNVSEMKQLAARDFEDLLQCAIPAFEGLLPPPHNNRVLALLFTLGEWHGLAKLRQHTDHTLEMLDVLTTRMGDQLRAFVKDTCAGVDTKELPREYQARKRRETRKRQKGKASANKRRKTSSSEQSSAIETCGDNGSDSRRSKTLNLKTYKFHALGDVVPTIRMFGTTDSYSTQTPEGFHRYPKRHYKRTSKKNVSRQLSRIQMRQARLRKLRKQLLPDPSEGYVDEEASQLPYFIGASQNNPVNLPAFIQAKRNDPAARDFYPKLRQHLLPRVYRALLWEAEKSPDRTAHDSQRIELLHSLVAAMANGPSPETQRDADQIYLHSDRLYQHGLLHINYTSYDVRRESDTINPKTSRRDVMCLRKLDEDDCPATAHRFMHARVLGVYHVNIMYKGRGASDLRRRRFDFLFVRWFEFCSQQANPKGLDRVRLRPLSKPESVGFLDPADVIRASHIIPRYSCDRLHTDTAGLILSKLAQDGEDWKEYFVNRSGLSLIKRLCIAHSPCSLSNGRFVDRDMLMRYKWGIGIGHIYSHSDAPDSNEARSPDEGETEDATAVSDAGSMDDEAEEAEPPNVKDQLEREEALDDRNLNEINDDDDAENSPEHTLDNLEEEELEVAGEDTDEESEGKDSDSGSDSDIPEPDSDDDL